ncbi:MAG: hypothetical protein HYT22_03490 [Candidatus Niyogibacteria bacterium]|nr:hypothetical protein [Candidatus Niyogibacteria bacterium]
MNKILTSSFQLPASNSRGQAALTAVLFFIFISLALVGGFGGLAASELQQVKTFERSKRSYLFAEGALEDAIYRLKSGKNMPSSVSYTDGDLSATTVVTDTVDAIEIETRGADSTARRAIKASLADGTEVAFNYGMQIGDGGLAMRNTASVLGNVYSNGPVTGENKNIVYGDIISAGADGLADGTHATSSIYAHTIRNSEIDKDAHYQIISGTTVGGTLYPASPDQPDADFQISDGTIEGWEQAATTTILSSPCPRVITGTVTLGPAKITCDVEIGGHADVTLGGTLWITGNLIVKDQAKIRAHSSLGQKSVIIIVDNPSNRISSSKIILQNQTLFFGSGAEGSYVLVISMNTSAEGGGGERAMEIKDDADGALLVYAPHGKILLQNSIELREVTGYAVEIKDSAMIVYETGLASLLFESGPEGGLFIDSWKEIP